MKLKIFPLAIVLFTVFSFILTSCSDDDKNTKEKKPQKVFDQKIRKYDVKAVSTTEDTSTPSSSIPAPPINSSHGDTWIRPADGMVMVYVPAGQFKMGYSDAQVQEILRMYSDGQQEWYKDEQPAHAVDLDAFWIDQTEVTNAQFCKFLNKYGNQREEGIRWLEPEAGHRGEVYGLIEEIDGVFRPKTGYENYPVIEVSWYGAAAYSVWINGRLPTEAEWEYAARGPDNLLYPWGNTFDGKLVNYRDASFTFTPRGFAKDTAYNDGHASWAPVGSYPNGASWCGTLDMAGNVWEWVNDWWDSEYYALSPGENPQGPISGTVRIARGGSWYDPRWHVCSGGRKGLSPSSYRIHWVGFRCIIPIHP